MAKKRKSLAAILEEDSRADQVELILQKAAVDFSKELKPPKSVMKIRCFSGGEIVSQRLFTSGNFSALIGKQKSKKTILSSIFITAATVASAVFNKFTGHLHKPFVYYFDTEQGEYDVRYVVNRIERLGGDLGKLKVYSLRRFAPRERLEIINHAIERYGDEMAYVVIDGIADLVTSINNEDEASNITTHLLRWTADYDIHITVIIHQNKGDNFATGHLGSAVMKKCEALISVTKNEQQPEKSVIEAKDMRGAPHFPSFELKINQQGIPEIDDLLGIAKSYVVRDDEQDIPF